MKAIQTTKKDENYIQTEVFHLQAHNFNSSYPVKRKVTEYKWSSQPN